MSGFSPRNVWDMRRLYEVYSAPEFLSQAVRETGKREADRILRQSVAELEAGEIRLQPVAKIGGGGEPVQLLRQLVAEIPWGQNLLILNLLNDKERGPGDQPSIGIILCAEKDDVEVEYALRTKANPIGVAAYALQSKLPGELKGKLPAAQQLADTVLAEMEGGK